MEVSQFWKNFNLGTELSVSGMFIYNGLRCYYEIQSLDNTDELFEVLYNFSVGFERLLKIAVVLLEHSDLSDQEALERSLITHSHLDLLHRVKKCATVNLGKQHNDFLGLLGNFYKTLRYDRFSISSIKTTEREKEALLSFLNRSLDDDLEPSSSLFGNVNDAKYKKFIRRIVTKISNTLYKIIKIRASELNLYTYELRHGSKAESVFIGKADIPSEEILWKELLVFFMNTQNSSGYIDFLRSIEPLEFDPELTPDYLDCFQSDSAKSLVIGELETLYGEIEECGKRLELINIIGNPNFYFDIPDTENES
ncbi:hypothetical protein DSCO28_01810 [Desulfosarcina ovata subsp. sediminis]|uniref:Uncharacterized protein n=1 Tax=Desulfosarcina ovata subsp. sediminis TaxID=885957 RepID=A0A5K7ZH67_9BACT|nr:hypothetical protein [Desulfosarcina ovata]BBO79615.1 hypothetical protein DSCO28_01810 [Desulfosarcina ovata subsp. sediminis]